MKTDFTEPQLFLDAGWHEYSSFVTRIWRRPKKFPDPVLTAQHPREQYCPFLYDSVLHRRGPAIVGEYSSRRVARLNIMATFPGGRDAVVHGLLELADIAGRWRCAPYHSLTDQEMGKLKRFVEETHLPISCWQTAL
jgi:hypothetical protein